MEPNTPPQATSDHPVWGPPRDPLISSRPPQRATQRVTRRVRPAERARRVAGMATLASGAAIVGYMATAGAMQPSSNAVVTPVVGRPVAVTPATTTPATTTPATATPATTTPVVAAVPAAPTRQPTQRTRPAPPGQPNSSSHGS